MAGPEDKYRHDLVIPELRSWGFDVQHHEDRIYSDIPDLSFACESAIDGWIEIKYSPAGIPQGKAKFWPRTLTQGQVDWLLRRFRAGNGKCYIWWGSPDEHVLMRIDISVMFLGRQALDARSSFDKYPGRFFIAPTVKKLGAMFSRALRSGVY